jgi:hypothetical protein
MSDVTLKQALPDLATKLLKAAEIREESWDAELSAGRYTVSYVQACKQACDGDEMSAQLLRLLLSCCWTDALDWAKDVIEKQETNHV